MKIESLREVKAKLSKIVKELPSERSVVITKNGRPCAVLLPVTEETDLESMLLAHRKDFWQLLDRAHKEGVKKGFTRLEDVDLGRIWINDRNTCLVYLRYYITFFKFWCGGVGCNNWNDLHSLWFGFWGYSWS